MQFTKWLPLAFAATIITAGCGSGNKAPSGLAYALSTAIYAQDTTIAPNNPTSTGGAVTLYSVNPALPLGLNLSSRTGVISGAPTVARAATTYLVRASNSSGDSTASLNITVNPAPLSASDINLIFVVSEDLANNAAGDVNAATGNLTGQGLHRSLLLATYLQQQVLGKKNVTGIYVIEPMTHLQTTNDYPDMSSIESIQQFAMLNQITLSSDLQGGTPYTASSYPLYASYGIGPLPDGVAPSLVPCQACQGLDYNNAADNENLLKGIIQAKAAGFYVFSAPWKITSALLANVASIEGYALPLPASYAGPNFVYALSISPTGNASFATFDSNVSPRSSYPTLPSPVVSSGCPAQTAQFQIAVTGGQNGAVIPSGINTNETFYMVRHAEAHPQGFWDDGNYVAQGQWRALDLPNALKGKINPDQVMSIDPAQAGSASVSASGNSTWSYVRPSLTVAPYAIATGLPYNLAASFELLAQNPPAQLATQASGFFFNGGKFSNQKVLLAWEHDHIPATVNALVASYFRNGGGPVAPNWPSGDYDTVWTVTLDAVGNLKVDNTICEGIDTKALPMAAPLF